MRAFSTRIFNSLVDRPGDNPLSPTELWHQAAEEAYLLYREFADRFDAKLTLGLRSQRVGWQREGHSVYGILLPDPIPSADPDDDEWYIYYVWGETLFRRTRDERA